MELLVRTFDNQRRRGDVIAVHKDGSYWGPCELKNPSYMILRVAIAEKDVPTRINLDALAGLGYTVPAAEQAREARYPNGLDSQNYMQLPAKPIVELKTAEFKKVIG